MPAISFKPFSASFSRYWNEILNFFQNNIFCHFFQNIKKYHYITYHYITIYYIAYHYIYIPFHYILLHYIPLHTIYIPFHPVSCKQKCIIVL